MCVSFVVCCMPHVEVLIIICVSFKLIAYSSGQSVLWDQRAIAYPLCSSIQKYLSCTGQIPSLTMNHICLLHSLDFGFRGQWSGYRDSFWKVRLLTMTIQPCILSFNVQDMTLVGPSGFFKHASASVDGCCLYIIIHYGMLQWDWGIGFVLEVAGLNQNLFKQ